MTSGHARALFILIAIGLLSGACIVWWHAHQDRPAEITAAPAPITQPAVGATTPTPSATPESGDADIFPVPVAVLQTAQHIVNDFLTTYYTVQPGHDWARTWQAYTQTTLDPFTGQPPNPPSPDTHITATVTTLHCTVVSASGADFVASVTTSDGHTNPVAVRVAADNGSTAWTVASAGPALPAEPAVP